MNEEITLTAEELLLALKNHEQRLEAIERALFKLKDNEDTNES